MLWACFCAVCRFLCMFLVCLLLGLLVFARLPPRGLGLLAGRVFVFFLGLAFWVCVAFFTCSLSCSSGRSYVHQGVRGVVSGRLFACACFVAVVFGGPCWRSCRDGVVVGWGACCVRLCVFGLLCLFCRFGSFVEILLVSFGFLAGGLFLFAVLGFCRLLLGAFAGIGFCSVLFFFVFTDAVALSFLLALVGLLLSLLGFGFGFLSPALLGWDCGGFGSRGLLGWVFVHKLLCLRPSVCVGCRLGSWLLGLSCRAWRFRWGFRFLVRRGWLFGLFIWSFWGLGVWRCLLLGFVSRCLAFLSGLAWSFLCGWLFSVFWAPLCGCMFVLAGFPVFAVGAVLSSFCVFFWLCSFWVLSASCSLACRFYEDALGGAIVCFGVSSCCSLRCRRCGACV